MEASWQERGGDDSLTDGVIELLIEGAFDGVPSVVLASRLTIVIVLIVVVEADIS